MSISSFQYNSANRYRCLTLVSTLAVLLIFGSYSLQSQSLRFGKVPKEEVMMTVYPEDSTAEAVVLGEVGFSALKYDQNNGFYLSHERHTRIKILKKEGYRWADVAVTLFGKGGDSESLNSLKAATYNMENGKVKSSKLDRSAVFDEAVDESRSLRKFTLPNVREGSVIEYSYTVRSDFFFNLQSWRFQDEIPKRWSKYTVEIPEYFVYNKEVQGIHPLALDESKPGNDRITFTTKGRRMSGTTARISPGGNAYKTEQINIAKTTYTMMAEKVPGFKPEPYMGDWVDYVTEVKFGLETVNFPGQSIQRFGDNWTSLNLSMDRNSKFGQMANGAAFLNDQVQAITSGASSDIEKVAAIQRFVKSKLAWNGNHRVYATKLSSSLMNEGKGASSDINLLLTNMLRKAGLNADPVMVSTRGHGRVNVRAPQTQQFNHVLAAVDLEGGTLLLDATEKNLPFNLLPTKCLNGQGWRVSEKRPGWVNLNSSGMEGFLFNGDFVINAEGKLEGKADIRFSDYSTRDIRYQAALEQDKLVEKLNGQHNFELKDWSISGGDQLSKPITISGTVINSQNLDEAGDLLFINPYLMDEWDENPFSEQDRRYPIDFVTKRNARYYFTLTIPEGYVVEELPENLNIALDNNRGKFMYLVSQKGNVISFRSIFSLTGTLFSPYEYEFLRDFFRKMIEQRDGQIVLKKAG